MPNQFSAGALEGLEEVNEENEASEDNLDDPNFDTDNRFDPHGAEFDQAAQQYSIHQRIIHFLHPHHISNVTRASVERALLIEAGTIVTDSKTMDKDSRSTLMVETYRELVKGFDSHHFHPESLQSTMLSRLYQAKLDISGQQLWDRFKEYRNDLRSNFNIQDSNIPSGKQLRDVYNLFLVKMFKTQKENVSFYVLLFYLHTCKLTIFSSQRLKPVKMWMMTIFLTSSPLRGSTVAVS